MFDLSTVSLKVSNFKCFGEEPQGFDQVLPVNFVIGRNNSGKSALLDMIQRIATGELLPPRELWHGKTPPLFMARAALSQDLIYASMQVSRAHANGTQKRIARAYDGTTFAWCLTDPQQHATIHATDEKQQELAGFSHVDRTALLRGLPLVAPNPLKHFNFQRIYADRDIRPEEDTSIAVQGSGEGTTNIIQRYINRANKPRELVQHQLLGELNKVFGRDADFSEILCQQLEDRKWEICLLEKNKGLIPLSQSGSGLKTIIILLAHMILVPNEREEGSRESKQPAIFACEELELVSKPG